MLKDRYKRRLHRILLTGSVFYCLTNTALSQGVKMKWYSVNEGLSQSLVHCFFEDTKGFMWIGTGNGLNKFDGYNFTTYRSGDSLSEQLSSNTIRSIIDDGNSTLLIGTDKGICTYNAVTQKFGNEVALLPGFENFWAYPVSFTEDSAFFCIGIKGLYSYNFKSKKLYPVFPSKLNIQWTYEDSKVLWLCVHPDILECFDKETHRIDVYRVPISQSSLVLNNLDKLDKGHLLIPTSEGLFIFDKETKKFELVPETKDQRVEDVLKDVNGNIWLGVENEGICEYTHNWKLIRTISDNDIVNNNSSYSFKHPRNLYEGRSGNIWVGTDGSGFCKLSLHQLKFDRITSPKVPLSSNFVKCFYQDEDSLLYVGTYNEGLNILDRKTGKVQVLKNELAEKYSLPSNSVYCIANAGNNSLWIGTDKGLALYDIKKKMFNPVENKYEKEYTALQIFKRLNGDIIIPTLGALYKVDKDNTGNYSLSSLSPGTDVWHIIGLYESSDSTLYLVHYAGLITIIKRNEYNNQIQQSAPVEGKYKFHAFWKDEKGELWAGSEDGLELLTPDLKIRKCFTTKDGLTDNYIYGILGDKNGNLWISTNKGISKFDEKTNKFRNYRIEDGLQSFEYNTGAYYKTRNGEMIFGGINGFNIFYPDSVKDNPSAPKTVITSFQLFDKEYRLDSSSIYKSVVKLNYNQNIVTFGFAGLEYTNPLLNEYEYKLDGVDKDWVMAGKTRFARYADLQPGQYYFFVRSSNNDGIWGQSTGMSIVITPPYWQTVWFKVGLVLFMVIMLTGMIVYVVRKRYKKLLEYHERQREIEKVRMRISKDIHDDLGAGLSKIKVLTELMSTKVRGSQEIETGIKSITDTSTNLIENMRDLVWMLNPENTTLDNLIARIREYSSDYLADFPVEYSANIPETIPEMAITADAYRNIFSIVKECLQNSIKHADANEIKSEVKVSESDIYLSISDNGKGFVSGTDGRGNGLRNIRYRAESLGGKLDIFSEPGKGTRVNILIAINSITKSIIPLS